MTFNDNGKFHGQQYRTIVPLLFSLERPFPCPFPPVTAVYVDPKNALFIF